MKRRLLLLVLTALLAALHTIIHIGRLYYEYTLFKAYNVSMLENAYESYVSYHLLFPDGKDLQLFYYQMQNERGIYEELNTSNPIYKYPIKLIYFEDSLKYVKAVSLVRRNDLRNKSKIKDFNDYKFIDFILKKYGVLLFKSYAYRCGGDRGMRFFRNNTKIVNDSELRSYVKSITSQFLKDKSLLKELSYGDRDLSYGIMARHLNGEVILDVVCEPQNHIFLENNSIDSILNILRQELYVDILYEACDYYYFPIIID